MALAQTTTSSHSKGLTEVEGLKVGQVTLTERPTGCTVILAEELTPADTALLDPRRIAGFATVLGGAESHTAIMARSRELPAVLGIPELLTKVKSGDQLVIDGYTGRVVIHPNRERLGGYNSVDDLDDVPGFPEEFLADLKRRVSV